MESKDNREILMITIDISEQVKGVIAVHEKDDPEKLSEEFLMKYSLDKSMKTPLISVIKSHQQKYQAKKSVHKKKLSMDTVTNSSFHKTAAQRILNHSLKFSGSYKSSSCSKINYGQLLYDKGCKMKENRRKFSEERLAEKENESKKNLTFKPQISRNSLEIVRDLSKDQKTKKNHELVLELKAKAEENQMKECYFVPMIGEKSSKHSEKKNIFDSLYADACVRRKSQDISKSSSKDTFLLLDSKRSKETDEFLDRLANSKKKTEKELDRLRQELDNGFDKVTGQKLFVPLTGRKPFSTRGERPV